MTPKRGALYWRPLALLSPTTKAGLNTLCGTRAAGALMPHAVAAAQFNTLKACTSGPLWGYFTQH